jgi:hypothetical protein
MKHVGSCNVQCLNAAIYKKYVKQNHSIVGKYVEFSHDPKSLDDIDALYKIELTRLGFSDFNTALANTISSLGECTLRRLHKGGLEQHGRRNGQQRSSDNS